MDDKITEKLWIFLLGWTGLIFAVYPMTKDYVENEPKTVYAMVLAIIFSFILVLGFFKFFEKYGKKSLNSLQHQNDINSDDDINKNEENDCPLSSKDWTFFLGNEITNVENEGYRNFNYVYPTFAIFAAIMAILINSMFSTANNPGISADGKSNIFYAIFQGWVALNIVFYGLFLGFILVVIEFFVKLKKANILREIRNNVLKGSLKNTNQIHKKWENVMQLKYRELLILVFTRRLE